MKRLFWLLCLVAGCRLAAPPPMAIPEVEAELANARLHGAAFVSAHKFSCPAGPTFIIRAVRSDAVDLVLPDQVRRLRRQKAGSGVKYSDSQVTIWNRGDEAVFYDGGRSYPCREARALSIREDAHLRGVQFRAAGSHETWVLEVWDDLISFSDDTYGTAIVPLTVPEKVENLTIYVSATEAHRLQVVIEARDCVNARNGERFEASVEVNIDGDAYRGCGYAP
jgi:membrane-bound inhibitor of C-type lysozyme/uncharacterized membrane protein